MTDLHLWNPQGTADVDPLSSTSGGLHGSALFGTQLALWQDAEGTDPTQPAALRDFLDAITRLKRNPNTRSVSRKQAEMTTQTGSRCVT